MKYTQHVRKLIRKLHPIDIVFIAVAIIFVIGFYFVFKRETTWVTIRFKVTDDNPLYAVNSPRDEFAHAFIVGDTEKDSFGRVVSEIVRVESYKDRPDQRVVYLDIRLKATFNPRKNIYTVRGKDMLFGETITFSFSKVHFKGMVVDLPGLNEALPVISKKTVVKAQLRYESRTFSDIYGAPNFLANSVHAGDTVVDSQGNILARVLDVIISPAKRVVVGLNGQTYIVNDPELKDVYYTIELATREINGITYMFDYDPVVIGRTIPLIMSKVFLWPTITEIIE